MKDFQGVELVIDDWVAFEQPNYRNLVRGKIVGFTTYFVKVQYFYQNRWHDFRISPSDTIKLNDQNYEPTTTPF